MKKVGIVTYFGHNYGACLQAYAVQKVVEQFNNESEIINYLPKVNQERKWKRRFKYLFHPFKYLNDKKINLEYKKRFTIRAQKFDKFIAERLKITSEYYEDAQAMNIISSKYDVYTTGSDQLWNPAHHGANKVYLLDFVDDTKIRLAFSPSIARKTVPEKYKEEFKRMLSKFDYISVREDVNVDTVKQLVPEKEVVHLLDPTFLLYATQWDEILDKPLFDEPYIFSYLFGDLNYIGEFLEKKAEESGMRVIALPYNSRELSNPDIQNYFDAGPSEFVNLIKNASLIITDSFHATAFSINYNKPFYTLLRQEETDIDNMNSRFTSILNLLQLESRLIMPGVKFDNVLDDELDYSIANEILKKEREKAMAYLSKGLG